MKRGQLVAEAGAGLWRYCATAQPNMDGSEMWTHEDFVKRQSKHAQSMGFACVYCGHRFLVAADTKVMVSMTRDLSEYRQRRGQ